MNLIDLFYLLSSRAETNRGECWDGYRVVMGYQVLEKSLLRWIELDRERDPLGGKDIEGQLQSLSDLVNDYVRIRERYKHDAGILRQVQEDWEDYNRWACSAGGDLRTFLDNVSKGKLGFPIDLVEILDYGEVKREEIERRFKKLLR